MKRFMKSSLLLLFVLALSACGDMNDEGPNGNEEQDEAEETTSMDGHSEKAGSGKSVHVNLINIDGEEVGTALLSQVKEGVEIQIEAWDLPPGVHGYHIHEKGICEPPTFESAGGHYNPTNAKHGFDHPEGPHAGDLPNIEVNKDGKVQYSYLNKMVTLNPDEENSLFREGGTSLMIHSKPDDYVSQPAGDAGERIACGVISE